MNDEQKTAEQLLDELAAMRQRVGEFEAAVSELKRAERVAHDAQLFAESIVETVRGPLLVLDAELCVISANTSFYRTFQVLPERTENHPIYELGNRQWDIPRLRELLEEILPKNTHFHDFKVEYDFPHIGRKTMLLNARRVKREGVGTQRVLLAIEDITERRRMEEDLAKYQAHLEELVEERTAELAKSIETLEREITERKRAEEELEKLRRRNELILNSAGEGIYGLDRHGKTTFVNPAAARMIGWEVEELIGQTQHDILHHTKPDGTPYPREECPIYSAFKDGDVHHADDEIFWRKDGTSFPVEYVSTPIRDERGDLVGAVVTFKDITERKRAEEELHRINRALRVLSGSNQAVVRAPEEAELMQEFCRIIVEDGGYRLAWAGFAEQDDGKRVRPVAQAGFEEGYLDSLNITWADTERSQGPTGTAIRTGRPSVAQDILTDPKFEPWRAEATKRGYASSIALPLFEDDRVFGALNVYAAEPDAFDKEEVELLVELASDLAYGIVAARTRVERKRAEEELRQAHEELRQHINYIEKAQDQLIRFEKLASVGQLSASISHEILNPLNVITMNLHMMLADPNTPSEMAEDLRVMQEQANRIVKISQNLLYFARQRQPERRHLELNDTIKRTLSLLEHEFRLGNIAVELKLAEGLQNIFADQDQLQQVVLNLLTNARDVMPDGGSITISTSEVEPLFLGGENAIEISVEDTGPGIDSGYMNKLFDPFFTTKPEGEGTGLGLSICHGIVKAHEGQIWAENTSGGGAAFIIRLPIGPTEESSA